MIFFVPAYRDILTMPKYIITASNDEFFLPDDSHYFYDQMNGPTFLRWVFIARQQIDSFVLEFNILN